MEKMSWWSYRELQMETKNIGSGHREDGEVEEKEKMLVMEMENTEKMLEIEMIEKIKTMEKMKNMTRMRRSRRWNDAACRNTVPL